MSSYGNGPSPKGTGAQNLLAGLMESLDETPQESEPPEQQDSTDAAKEKPKGKKDPCMRRFDAAKTWTIRLVREVMSP